jgi:hypothetical protein
MTLAQLPRISSKFVIDEQTGCWNWTGAKSPAGYGKFHNNSGTMQAHRFMYELTKGKISRPLVIDHLCRNRGCVNPKHMEVVTHRENTMRGENIAAKYARATHCVHGHPFDEANTYVTSKGLRHCRTCKLIRERVYNNYKD